MDFKIESVQNGIVRLSVGRDKNVATKVSKGPEIYTRVENMLGSKEEIRRKVEEFLKNVNRGTNLKMHYDKEIDRVIVTILEAGTEKVIRQIPPEEFVTFLKRFRKNLTSIFERSI